MKPRRRTKVRRCSRCGGRCSGVALLVNDNPRELCEVCAYNPPAPPVAS